MVDEIQSGNASLGDLMDAVRPRLLRMVNLRISPQLNQRVDAEDIVQETFVTASKRFDEYLSQPKVPVYVWFRGLAIERMIDAMRFHLGAGKRSVNREEEARHWVDQSTVNVLKKLPADQKTPSQVIADQQRSVELKNALQKLPDRYRDVLVLRFFETLTLSETAATLEITESNTKVLQFRAIKKLEQIITADFNWQSEDRVGPS
ncbi:MAG: sigma-70 family RNA polymerase sigma factor [Planctomycetota bacterium]